MKLNKKSTVVHLHSFFILLFIITFTAIGQQKDTLRSIDSLENGNRFSIPDLSLSKPLFIHSEPPGIIQSDSLRLQSKAFLHQSMTKPLLSLSWSNKDNLGIGSSWKREVFSQQEYKTWKMIMMSVEAGGVAYLAYLHLKKYGLK